MFAKDFLRSSKEPGKLLWVVVVISGNLGGTELALTMALPVLASPPNNGE